MNLNSNALRSVPNVQVLDLSNNEIVLTEKDVDFLTHTPKLTHVSKANFRNPIADVLTRLAAHEEGIHLCGQPDGTIRHNVEDVLKRQAYGWYYLPCHVIGNNAICHTIPAPKVLGSQVRQPRQLT